LGGYNSNLDNDDIRKIIELSCDDINYPGDSLIGSDFDYKSGYGRINMENAFNLINYPNSLKQWTATGGSIYSSTGQYEEFLAGVDWLDIDIYLVMRHEVRKNITFPESFCTIKDGWGRGVDCIGFSTNPRYGMDYCEIVPNTLTQTGATLRTYVYQVWNQDGTEYLGCYPTTPSNVVFAYSVLGIPNPTIDGPSLICSTNSIFTLNDLPPGANVDWDTSDNITIVNSTSTSCTVCANGTGTGWVEAGISGICEPISIRKDIDWVGVPYVNPATIQFECADGSGYFCTNAFGNEFSFTFDHQYNYFDIKLTNLSETQTLTQFTIYYTEGTMDIFPPPQEGTYLFHVRGNNDCGTATNWSKESVEYVDCGMGGLFSLDIYPNPTTEQATITIVSNEDMNAVTQKVDEAWQLEVYTQGQLPILNIPAIVDNKYILNTSGWKSGMYFIRVYFKDEVLWCTLIVNK